MALALVRCSIETDQGGTPHARPRVSLVSWEGGSHALLFMVPLSPPSVRPMAQALRLPFEYYYIHNNNNNNNNKGTYKNHYYLCADHVTKHAHTRVYMHTQTHAHVYTHIHARTHTHTHTHTHAHALVHAHTHTCTHTHTQHNYCTIIIIIIIIIIMCSTYPQRAVAVLRPPLAGRWPTTRAGTESGSHDVPPQRAGNRTTDTR